MFYYFLQKASKKRVIGYSIAVKNACFCRVIECIAPSVHALTARIATALLMWGVSFVFSSSRFQLFLAGWEICDQSEQIPDSCIYETTIIFLYHSMYSDIMYGIGY